MLTSLRALGRQLPRLASSASSSSSASASASRLSSLKQDVAGGPKKRKPMPATKMPKGEGTADFEKIAEKPVNEATKIDISITADDEMPERPLSALDRRRRESTKEVVMLTEAAADRIRSLLALRDDGPIGVRVGVRRRGCNGLTYTMDYEYEGSPGGKFDTKTTQHGVTVFVDADAFMFVVGTIMDFSSSKSSEKFVFINPNSGGSCGCGESWVPKKIHRQAAAA